LPRPPFFFRKSSAYPDISAPGLRRALEDCGFGLVEELSTSWKARPRRGSSEVAQESPATIMAAFFAQITAWAEAA